MIQDNGDRTKFETGAVQDDTSPSILSGAGRRPGKELSRMVKTEGFSAEKRNCVKCRKRTKHYVEYGYKDGPAVRIPVCVECQKHKRIEYFLPTQMRVILPVIQNAIWASKITTYDEEELMKERNDL